MAEKEIREFEDLKNTQNETQKHKRLKKHEDSISELWNNLKQPYVYGIAVPEGDKKDKQKEYLEIQWPIFFPNLIKTINPQIQKA